LAGRQQAEAERLIWSLELEPKRQAAPKVALAVVLACVFLIVLRATEAVILPIRARYLPVLVDDVEDEPPRPLLPDAQTSRFLMDGNQGTRVDVGLDDYHLERLALALHKGVSFAERNFSATFVPNFRAVQDAFIAQGLAEWRNHAEPRQGVRLTDNGARFMFEQVLGLPSPADVTPGNGGGTHASPAYRTIAGGGGVV
jgi:hypothetical protein